MGNRYTLKQRIRLRNAVKNIVVYGGLGMTAGVITCVIALYVAQIFNSETTFANSANGITTTRQICRHDIFAVWWLFHLRCLQMLFLS